VVSKEIKSSNTKFVYAYLSTKRQDTFSISFFRLNERIYQAALLGLFTCAFFTGCGNYTPGNTELGAATGTALGAGLGAIVGNQSGNAATGAALGAAAGALAGGMVGNSNDKQLVRSAEQDEMVRRQQKELERQQRELEDIRRQEFHDAKFRKDYESNRTGTIAPDISIENRSFDGDTSSRDKLTSGSHSGYDALKDNGQKDGIYERDVAGQEAISGSYPKNIPPNTNLDGEKIDLKNTIKNPRGKTSEMYY
jgi:uncharacterized protein YcfJ